MIIAGLQKTTLIDYPGKIACVVFLAACNFRCPWCYSSELVLPLKIAKQPRISEKYFFDFLKERKGMLEGVVICGGEPTINKDLPGFIKKIKKMGFLVKLDTNGSNPEILEKLIKEKLVDYIALDIKASARKYRKATGVKTNLEKIKKSIDIIKNSGVDYEFRTTVVPGVHNKEDILEIAKWIRGVRRYYLQNFRAEKTLDPDLEKVKPYLQEFLLEIQTAISPFFEVCQIR